MDGLLVDVASTRIDWVAEHCRLLRSISAEFKDTLPFRGFTIDVEAIAGSSDVAGVREYAHDLMTFELRDGRRIHVISRGHMFNLAGPRPMGNSIESMDLGFALQARCLEAVANGSVNASSCVVPVLGRIDAAIATSYLDRKYPATPRA